MHVPDAMAVQRPSAQADQPLGCVLSVRGSRANIGILQHKGMKHDDVAITVGKCVAVVGRSSVVLGYVTEISIEVPDIARQRGYSASARIDLMGEIRTDANGVQQFQRGVSEYPLIGDHVVPISGDDLQVVYGGRTDDSISIGQLQQDKTLCAQICIDDMLSRHFALFGTTGVGKSSGVALILREVLKVRPNLRIFLLDAHNEYARCFADRAEILNPGNLKLPFWLFNFEETVDVVFGGRPGVEEETEILAEMIPVAKSMYAQSRTSAGRHGIKRVDPRNAGYTADTPVPYRLADLLSLIDEQMGKLENRSSRMKYHKLIMRIESVSSDPRYNFMFENANVGGDTMAEVLCQLFRLPPNGKPMTIMELAGFPSEVVDAVVSVLCRMAFDFGLWSEGAFPMLFVCEEAHRYASADRSLGFGPTRRALSRIAKEGRKYGVFFGLVSQRPAELDPTIISQCSTLFVMRMSNDRDQAIVRSAVSDAASNLLHLVPSLGTREVLAFGEGVVLPARMTFRDLPRHQLPSREALGNARSPAAASDATRFVHQVVARWRETRHVAKHDPADQSGQPQADRPAQAQAAPPEQPQADRPGQPQVAPRRGPSLLRPDAAIAPQIEERRSFRN